MEQNLSEILGDRIVTERLDILLKTEDPDDEEYKPMLDFPDFNTYNREDGRHVGSISLYPHDNGPDMPSKGENNIMISYGVNEGERRQGFATEALAGLTAKLLLEDYTPVLEILMGKESSSGVACNAGYQKFAVDTYCGEEWEYFAPNVIEPNRE